MCKPLINTSAEKYDDTSDYHDEDEEVVFQYGTSAWTSDPTQEVERSLQLFLGQCETYCFYDCFYNYNCFYHNASVELLSSCDEWKTFRKQHTHSYHGFPVSKSCS